MSINWFSIEEICDEKITLAVLLTTYNNRYVIIKNRERGGWEIPGGRREAGESIVQTACRELYEETGAVHFKAAPFGVCSFNDTYGMAFVADVIDIQDPLPAYEIEDIQYVNDLPASINFYNMVHSMLNRWNETKEMTEPHVVEYRIKIS